MDIKDALNMISSMTAEELAKAVKEGKGLEGIRIIKDLWEDQHQLQLPDKSETKTGPTMHSSGAGVDKAIAEYSNPAPQVGTTEMYDMFTRSNIEGWGKLHAAVKAVADGMNEVVSLLKKSEEEKKEEKKEEMKSAPSTPEVKAEEPKHDEEKEDHKMKARIMDKAAKMWDSLAELETAFAKAEDGHDESKDIKGLDEAREHIEKAEKEIEAVEAHEKEEQAHQQAMKAQVYINLGWKSLSKATGLNRYGLHGYGNQADSHVPGDENADNANHDFKTAKAKAQYWALKAKSMEKSMGLAKDETAAAAAPVAAAPVAAPVAEPVSAVPVAAELSSEAKAELEATKSDLQRIFNERIAELNKRIETAAGHAMPPMTPVVLTKGGIKSEALAKSFYDKIEVSQEAGELTEESAGISRVLVDRYMAVGRGLIANDIVNQQLAKAPLDVQSFFEHLSQSA